MGKDYEKIANDFLVKLTWGGQHLCPDIIKENPEILNTKEMATTITPNTSIGNPSPKSYNLAFLVVHTLCQYRDEGIISEEQFNKTINTPSPETGETLLTSVLKETLKAAQKVENISDRFWRGEAIQNLNGFSTRLQDLIDQNGEIRADVNVPNMRGQYPLELIQSMSDGEHLHSSLATEHNCIRMATNPAVEAKIKHGMTGKSDVAQIDDSTQPRTKALLIDHRVDPNDPKNARYSNYSTPSDVSVVETDKPIFVASDVKDPLSVAEIHEAGKYILVHYSHSAPTVYNIDKLNDWHGQRLYLRQGDKWNEVTQDKIFSTITALCTKPGNSNGRV